MVKIKKILQTLAKQKPAEREICLARAKDSIFSDIKKICCCICHNPKFKKNKKI